MIDQGAMLLGPALAGVIIDWNPAYGAGFIALWNVVSLIIEISLLKQIYNSTEELQIPKDLDIEGNDHFYANLLLFIGARIDMIVRNSFI